MLPTTITTKALNAWHDQSDLYGQAHPRILELRRMQALKWLKDHGRQEQQQHGDGGMHSPVSSRAGSPSERVNGLSDL